MANTTNFNWETPDDTDLVKDGAAAIRTLGSAIDTSLVDLKGGTTGQILSKTSNTDMDFTWIANDQGDITEITASAPLTGGGSSGAITVGIQDGTTAQKGAVQLEDSTSSTSTTKAATPNSVKSAYDLANGAVAKSVIDAKGDLLVGSADNTIARLAVGTNDYVLTADSSATNGIKWAAAASGGGMTLLSTTTLSGSSTTITITPTGYTALMISFEGLDLTADDGVFININDNNLSQIALARYDSSAASVSGSKNSTIRYNNGTDFDSSTHTNAGVLWIYNPTSTTVAKVFDFRVAWLDGTGGTNWASYIGGGAYTGSSVSSIKIGCDTTTFQGGSVLVYGVK